MTTLNERISAVNWQEVTESMHTRGYALVENLLTHGECEDLKSLYDSPTGYRKKVVMERYRFGLGEYKYFDYPLPQIVQEIREQVYPNLAPIANQWMTALGIPTRFPDFFEELKKLCDEHNQRKPTALILKYGPGGYNTLHQDLYGEVYFPMQIVLFLSEPEVDYSGGEFVLTQQNPRAQSQAIVLKPRKGDMLIFTTNFRPVKGSRGYYRVNMKHGVSEVKSGERFTLGVIFHDGVS